MVSLMLAKDETVQLMVRWNSKRVCDALEHLRKGCEALVDDSQIQLQGTGIESRLGVDRLYIAQKGFERIQVALTAQVWHSKH